MVSRPFVFLPADRTPAGTWHGAALTSRGDFHGPIVQKSPETDIGATKDTKLMGAEGQGSVSFDLASAALPDSACLRGFQYRDWGSQKTETRSQKDRRYCILVSAFWILTCPVPR